MIISPRSASRSVAEWTTDMGAFQAAVECVCKGISDSLDCNAIAAVEKGVLRRPLLNHDDIETFMQEVRVLGRSCGRHGG
jgi:hypothetical protein